MYIWDRSIKEDIRRNYEEDTISMQWNYVALNKHYLGATWNGKPNGSDFGVGGHACHGDDSDSGRRDAASHDPFDSPDVYSGSNQSDVSTGLSAGGSTSKFFDRRESENSSLSELAFSVSGSRTSGHPSGDGGSGHASGDTGNAGGSGSVKKDEYSNG
jgi:hypothetical protein